ncbi:hypothetical protein Q7P37_000369 [Cladosporium fusiforme]
MGSKTEVMVGESIADTGRDVDRGLAEVDDVYGIDHVPDKTGKIRRTAHTEESMQQSNRPLPKIPVIDLSPIANPNTPPTTRLSLAQDLVSAFQTVGFAYLTNHTLSHTLLSTAFATSKDLFALSHTTKMQAPHPNGPQIHRGYSYPGLEKVSQYAAGDEDVGEALRETVDCKESYEIGSEENAEQPNVWLPEKSLPGFREFTLRFYWECDRFAREVLGLLASGLGLEGDDAQVLMRGHSGHNNQLRLLHYPAVRAGDVESKKMARMPAHSDWSSITLLFQDNCGGLEVEDPHVPGRFIPVTPIEDACVVNVGDLLMRWSNDTLKSTLHRVSLPPLEDRFEGNERMTRERYSVVYFVGADPDAVVECLPTCIDAQNPAKYGPITQREYCEMRSKVQYRTIKLPVECD